MFMQRLHRTAPHTLSMRSPFTSYYLSMFSSFTILLRTLLTRRIYRPASNSPNFSGSSLPSPVFNGGRWLVFSTAISSLLSQSDAEREREGEKKEWGWERRREREKETDYNIYYGTLFLLHSLAISTSIVRPTCIYHCLVQFMMEIWPFKTNHSITNAFI